ncbi:glutathione synthetase [Plesiocystis pacifica SIR-1]|uniref:Glutathione synthetase n=1 Tax=Plesiocystis pacifica SIR-1 TaxID=391625 RepID=A6GIC1_9BACT|nr:glutathione synthase [Plesiocystis pacifica]EDM74374.1 glutathione synthetase [Plesiocystis pacifica SIR-1]
MTDVLFVIDPLENLDPRADTSYVMITEALRRGHRPYYTTLAGLGIQGGQARAHVRLMGLAEGVGSPLVDAGEGEPRELSSFACVLMRKDPPVDEAFIAATWILDRAGTVVINEPSALRDLNEKLSMLNFPALIPDTRLLRDAGDVRAALEDMGGKMIVKPLLGYGGREILLAKAGDPNLSTIIEIATADGTRWTVAQQFLPDAKRGDKRILIVDGEAVGAVLRVPAAGELRDNFHTGGSPALTELSPRDREICGEVGPWLRERGILFAGIDVIGDYLTEINVTSPTGMQEINRLGGLEGDATMQAKFWVAVEARL